jgi:hypothetical protein
MATRAEVMIGYFSRKHATMTPTASCEYLTPNGKFVIVTFICLNEEEAKNYLWEDKVKVGEVSTFVREMDKPRPFGYPRAV